jgi:hypothetical protein
MQGRTVGALFPWQHELSERPRLDAVLAGGAPTRSVLPITVARVALWFATAWAAFFAIIWALASISKLVPT